MAQKTAQQLNDLTQTAAYKIVKALMVFDDQPEHVRQQAEQIVMQRVQMMRTGQQVNIDGLEVREVKDEEPKDEQVTPSEPETP